MRSEVPEASARSPLQSAETASQVELPAHQGERQAGKVQESNFEGRSCSLLLERSRPQRDQLVLRLRSKQRLHEPRPPGSDRQAIHTVYGGANLFKAASAKKLGGIALRNLDQYAPSFVQFARILALPGADALPENRGEIEALTESLEAAEKNGQLQQMQKSHPSAWLAYTIYQRVINKLQAEPIEDNRIDFEDGYGNRPDEEEDQQEDTEQDYDF